MKKIRIITVHPKFVESYFSFGLFDRAIKKDGIEIEAVDLRQFAVDAHGSVDGKPYGGGEGMVLRPEPLAQAVKSCDDRQFVVVTDPKGKIFSGNEAERLAKTPDTLTIICGRFSGIDQRFYKNYVDESYSVGEYVLSGGELPALSIVDAVLRFSGSLAPVAFKDSFAKGYSGAKEYPLYTKPRSFEGMEVPPVLLTGHNRLIEKWREENLDS